ncbi:MAG: hypothetical protein ACRENP_02705 [Longimicrobiales bacterium]
MSETRQLKYRQAGFAYLMVGILYESAVWVIWRNGLLPSNRGPIAVWMFVGAALVAVAVWLLWRYQNPWIPRAIFMLHALRVPSLIGGAFFPAPEARIPASLYLTALVIVLINLWMLARAGWDL